MNQTNDYQVQWPLRQGWICIKCNASNSPDITQYPCTSQYWTALGGTTSAQGT